MTYPRVFFYVYQVENLSMHFEKEFVGQDFKPAVCKAKCFIFLLV